jgi:hypothetical protein
LLYFGSISGLTDIAYRDKEVVGVFVRFRAPDQGVILPVGQALFKIQILVSRFGLCVLVGVARSNIGSLTSTFSKKPHSL